MTSLHLLLLLLLATGGHVLGQLEEGGGEGGEDQPTRNEEEGQVTSDREIRTSGMEVSSSTSAIQSHYSTTDNVKPIVHTAPPILHTLSSTSSSTSSPIFHVPAPVTLISISLNESYSPIPHSHLPTTIPSPNAHTPSPKTSHTSSPTFQSLSSNTLIQSPTPHTASPTTPTHTPSPATDTPRPIFHVPSPVTRISLSLTDIHSPIPHTSSSTAIPSLATAPSTTPSLTTHSSRHMTTPSPTTYDPPPLTTSLLITTPSPTTTTTTTTTTLKTTTASLTTILSPITLSSTNTSPLTTNTPSHTIHFPLPNTTVPLPTPSLTHSSSPIPPSSPSSSSPSSLHPSSSPHTQTLQNQWPSTSRNTRELSTPRGDFDNTNDSAPRLDSEEIVEEATDVFFFPSSNLVTSALTSQRPATAAEVTADVERSTQKPQNEETSTTIIRNSTITGKLASSEEVSISASTPSRPEDMTISSLILRQEGSKGKGTTTKGDSVSESPSTPLPPAPVTASYVGLPQNRWFWFFILLRGGNCLDVDMKNTSALFSDFATAFSSLLLYNTEHVTVGDITCSGDQLTVNMSVDSVQYPQCESDLKTLLSHRNLRVHIHNTSFYIESYESQRSAIFETKPDAEADKAEILFMTLSGVGVSMVCIFFAGVVFAIYQQCSLRKNKVIFADGSHKFHPDSPRSLRPRMEMDQGVRYTGTHSYTVNMYKSYSDLSSQDLYGQGRNSGPVTVITKQKNKTPKEHQNKRKKKQGNTLYVEPGDRHGHEELWEESITRHEFTTIRNANNKTTSFRSEDPLSSYPLLVNGEANVNKPQDPGNGTVMDADEEKEMRGMNGERMGLKEMNNEGTTMIGMNNEGIGEKGLNGEGRGKRGINNEGRGVTRTNNGRIGVNNERTGVRGMNGEGRGVNNKGIGVTGMNILTEEYHYPLSSTCPSSPAIPKGVLERMDDMIFTTLSSSNPEIQQHSTSFSTISVSTSTLFSTTDDATTSFITATPPPPPPASAKPTNRGKKVSSPPEVSTTPPVFSTPPPPFSTRPSAFSTASQSSSSTSQVSSISPPAFPTPPPPYSTSPPDASTPPPASSTSPAASSTSPADSTSNDNLCLTRITFMGMENPSFMMETDM